MIVTDFDEHGNPIYSEDPSAAGGTKSNSEKIFGLVIVLIGLACTLFIGLKIKRKVAEINKQAEEQEAKQVGGTKKDK
jgi:hypothetical protein